MLLVVWTNQELRHICILKLVKFFAHTLDWWHFGFTFNWLIFSLGLNNLYYDQIVYTSDATQFIRWVLSFEIPCLL